MEAVRRQIQQSCWAFSTPILPATAWTRAAPWQTFDGERTKYYWRSDLALAKGQTLLMGVERAVETAHTVTTFGGLGGSNGNTGAYAELQSAFGDRFFVASNIRHDENDAFGGHNTWRIAPAFLIPETQTKLKASYGTGFHAPSLNQLFDPLSGNPNLKPEESRGYDYRLRAIVMAEAREFRRHLVS